MSVSKPTQTQTANAEPEARQSARDMAAELEQSINEMLAGQGKPVPVPTVVAVRMQSGLSQSPSAKRLGVSGRPSASAALKDLAQSLPSKISDLDPSYLDQISGKGAWEPYLEQSLASAALKNLERSLPSRISDLDPTDLAQLSGKVDWEQFSTKAALKNLEQSLSSGISDLAGSYLEQSLASAALKNLERSLPSRISNLDPSDIAQMSGKGAWERHFQQIGDGLRPISLARNLIKAIDDGDDAEAERIASVPEFGLPVLRAMLDMARMSKEEQEESNERIRALESQLEEAQKAAQKKRADLSSKNRQSAQKPRKKTDDGTPAFDLAKELCLKWFDDPKIYKNKEAFLNAVVDKEWGTKSTAVKWLKKIIETSDPGHQWIAKFVKNKS